jgi:transposase
VQTELHSQLEVPLSRKDRPSIPLEQLLKAWLIMPLYSGRSDRLYYQMLDRNIQFRWFLDYSQEQAKLYYSTFSRLHEQPVLRLAQPPTP